MLSRKNTLLILACTLFSIFSGISQPRKTPTAIDTLKEIPVFPSEKNINLEETISNLDYAPPTLGIDPIPDIEKPAEPVGGMRKFISEFANKFVVSDSADLDNHIKFSLQFVVKKDGSLTNIKVINNTGYGIGDQAVRVLKSMPKWEPAEKNGVPIDSQFELPIIFKLQ